MEKLPDNWREFLKNFVNWTDLERILRQLDMFRQIATIYPPQQQVFHAFELTPPENTRVVIIGQDPYHEEHQAQGLAFSVANDVKQPPSLRNIFKEFSTDLGVEIPRSNSLENWAINGVLLLNAILSVESGRPGSHAKIGWEKFTDAVISALSTQKRGLAFILWGNFAIKKKVLINPEKHLILTGVHPSPLSASRGFFGSKPFSKVEEYLRDWKWCR